MHVRENQKRCCGLESSGSDRQVAADACDYHNKDLNQFLNQLSDC
jgi:hypothetical protein